MANYYASARSNYFRVKDLAAFRAAMTPLSVEVVGNDDDPQQVALLSDDEAGWPSGYWDEASDTDVEVDVAELVAGHLADGWVAVFMEAGHEKLRYVAGCATAINAAGQVRQIRLDDIYGLAKQLGPNVTLAEY